MNNCCNRYILVDKVPVLERDLIKWAEMFDIMQRRVAETFLGEVRVSTVFLGFDHSFHEESPPLLFETMVFGGPLDQEQERYSTWDEAIAGHEKMVKRVQEQEQT